MASYKIAFTFSGNPADTSEVQVTAGSVIFYFQFLTPIPGQVSNGVPIAIAVSDTVANMQQYFETTYNFIGLYTSTRNATTLTIYGDFDSTPVETISSTNISVTVLQTTPNLQVLNQTIQQATSPDKCNYVDVQIETNNDLAQLLQPYVDTNFSGTTNTIINLQRVSGVSTYCEIEDVNGQVLGFYVSTPPKLQSNLILLDVGIDSVLITNNTGLSGLEYSLDNTNWQTDNLFSGLSGGQYTLYIRDQYGCSITKSFEIQQVIDPTNPPPEYFLYPAHNPIFLAKTDDTIPEKNSKNTLSCDTLQDTKYKEIIYYTPNDLLKLQFKTSYQDLQVRDTLGNSYTPIKVASNIGKKIMLDCIITALPTTNEVGIYFLNSELYDYDTGASIGESLFLDGKLPEWVKDDLIIQINSINYSIVSINFNEDLNVEQAKIISGQLYNDILNAGGGDLQVQLKTIYNELDYDVYEVEIPQIDGRNYQVEVFFNGQWRMISEEIRVRSNERRLLKIEYYMNDNTDMFFQSGIVPVIRAKYDKVYASLRNESENYSTDEEFIQIDSKDYEVDVFEFLPMTKETARRLVRALSSDSVTINGIEYVKDSIDKLEVLGRSNLYVVSAKMIVKGSGLFRDIDVGINEVEFVNYDGINMLNTN